MADRNAYCCFCRAFHIPGQPHVKTFPEVDRRKPTANDRAVERLLEIANAPGCSVHDYEKGRDAAWDMVGDIIREEAERG